MAATGSARTGLFSIATMTSGQRIVSHRPVQLTDAALILSVLVADGKVQMVPCKILGIAAIINACALSSDSTLVRLAAFAIMMPCSIRWSDLARLGALLVVMVVPTSVSSSLTLILCPPNCVSRKMSLALGQVDSATNLERLLVSPASLSN